MREATAEHNLPGLELMTASPYDQIIPTLTLSEEDRQTLKSISEQERKITQRASHLYTRIKARLSQKVNAKHWPAIDQNSGTPAQIFEKAIAKFYDSLDMPRGEVIIDGENQRVSLYEETYSGDSNPMKVFMREGISALKELIALEIDVLKLSEEDFEEFLQTEYDKFDQLQRKIEDAVMSSHLDQLTQIKEVVNRCLCQELTLIVESLSTQTTVDSEVFQRTIHSLDAFFKKILLMPSGSRRKIAEIVPIFQKLVQAKSTLQPEQKTMLENVLEDHERTVFHLIDFDATMKDETSDDYESFMKITFGLDDEAMLARKERGWNAAIEFINTELVSRSERALTMDDLRILHMKFAEGIIPYFALGLRTDTYDEPQTTQIHKSEVVVTKENGEISFHGTHSKNLAKELEKFLDKINTIIALPTVLAPIASTMLGSRIYEYTRIHPNTEKNGNLAVLIAIAARAMRTGKKSDNTFHPNFFRRKSKALGPDILAHWFAFR